jgi:hypothetical protein
VQPRARHRCARDGQPYAIRRQFVVHRVRHHRYAIALLQPQLVAFAQTHFVGERTVHARYRGRSIAGFLQGGCAAHDGVSRINRHFRDALQVIALSPRHLTDIGIII